jgi:hypothetical protein
LADGQAAHAGEDDEDRSQAGAPFEPPEPFTVKEPALTAFFTLEPQASCRVSGADDIFWMTSKRPHRGQSYS